MGKVLYYLISIQKHFNYFLNSGTCIQQNDRKWFKKKKGGTAKKQRWARGFSWAACRARLSTERGRLSSCHLHLHHHLLPPCLVLWLHASPRCTLTLRAGADAVTLLTYGAQGPRWTEKRDREAHTQLNASCPVSLNHTWYSSETPTATCKMCWPPNPESLLTWIIHQSIFMLNINFPSMKS